MPPKKRSNKKKQKQPKKKQQNENKGQPPACTDLEPVAGPSSDQPPSDSESEPVAGPSSGQPPSYTVFEGAARPSSGHPPSYTVFEGAARPSSGKPPSKKVLEPIAGQSSGQPPSKTVLKGVAGPSSGQPPSNRVVEPIAGPSSSQLPSYTVYEGAARSSLKKLPPYTVFELVARPPPGQPPSYRILDQIAGPSSGHPSSYRVLDPIAGPSSGQPSSYRILDPIAGPSSGQPPSYRVLDPIAGPSSGQPPSYRVLEPVAGPSSGQPPSFNVLGIAGPSSRLPHSVSWVPGQTPTWRPLSPEPRPVPRLPEPLVVQVPSTVRPRVPGQSIPLPYPTPAPYTIPILPESGWSIVTPEPEDRLRVQLNTNLYFRDNLYTVHSFRQGEVVPDSPNLDSLSTGWILAQAMLLKDVMNQCRSLCFKLTQRVLPSNYRGFPLLQIERIRMLSRMRFRYLMDVFRERINAEINGIPTVEDTTERCKLVISSISWIPVERQTDDYTYFCLMQCEHVMYSTHTSATRFGIFQFFGPYIFPLLPTNFVIHFRFYRHANLRCIFPSHPLFGEASLNRDEVEQGKITLFCYDDTIGRDGFNIFYDHTLTENIAIPLPLSEWDSDSSDSDSD